MHVLMQKEVVARPLTNDTEVVDKAGLKSHPAVDLTLRYSGALILVTGCLTDATHSLRVEMNLRMKAPIAIKGGREQRVKVSAEGNVLPCSSSGTGHEDWDIDGHLNVGRDRSPGGRCQHEAESNG